MRQLLNLDKLSSFNEFALLQLVSWIDLMTSTLDLETLFLEVLKISRTTQLQVKCVLSKD